MKTEPDDEEEDTFELKYNEERNKTDHLAVLCKDLASQLRNWQQLDL
jgi:hypothetical protein